MIPRLIRIGLLAWAVAWFLPAHVEGGTLPEVLPGWQAFRVALSPIWRYGDFRGGASAGDAIISLLSGLTNLLAVVAALGTRIPTGQRLLSNALIVAALINAYWFVLSDNRGDFRVGYYLWWLSFVLLSVGFQPRRTATTPAT